MKRYRITNSFKKAIWSNKISMREMSKLLGFEVKNIVNKNYSIREDHFKKLLLFLNIKVSLKEVFLDYGKNLGEKALTQKISLFRKSGNLAEIVGIMLGDGNLWKNQIKISFDKRNEKYIEYVKSLFKNVFGIELRIKFTPGTNQANLYCYNRYLAQRLVDIGLQRGDKIKNRVSVPIWVKEKTIYSKRLIKGLIDTDGCIYFSKRDSQTYIKFTNFNPTLLKDFKEITEFLDYHFAKANKNNWCLYRKNEVAIFIKDIKPLKSVNWGRGSAW